MPDGNQIVAQAADGTQHIFPAGTDPSVIDRAMKVYVSSKPGAYQQRPGGPVLNAKDLPPADTTSDSTKRMRGAGLGLAEGMGIQPGQSGWDVIKNTLSGWGSGIKNQAVDSFHHSQEFLGEKGYDSPLSLVATPVDMLAHTIENSATNLEKTGKEGVGAVKSGDLEGLYRALGSGVGQIGTLRAIRSAPEAATNPIGDLAAAGREVMGEGASKVRVLADQHAHALEVQKHISGVAEAVHQDAQQAMSSVSQAVDAAKPQGAFDKLDVQNRLKTAMGDKLADPNQLPAPLRKLMVEDAPSYDAQMIKNTQGYVSKLKQSGLNDQGIQAALKQQGLKPAEIEAAMGANPGAMTFEKLKQARSDLGRQLDSLQGPAQAASKSAYGEMSTMLREGARDAGVEPDWLDATARWKNYLDDFQRSPVAKTLGAENAHDIMDPLAGKSRMQVADILQKYEPFGLDTAKVSQEISRFGIGETIGKLSRPTKMDLLMAGFSPKALAIRQLGPRIMRNPSVISAVAGKGFEDAQSIPSKQVFPSKVAAAKAVKGGSN